MRHALATLALLAASALAGCGTPAGPAPAAPREPLRIAAASDLQAVMPVLISRYRLVQGGDPPAIDPVFGSSVELAKQIGQGGPYDLFLCANREIVQGLARDGGIRAGSVRDYARGSLVLVVGRSVPAPIATIADLKTSGIKKIAIANPEIAPYGLAARQALESAGLWKALEPRIVRGSNVRQALQFVQSGNAEAGLVGRAIADVPEVRRIAIDPALYRPLVQALGVPASSKRADESGRFADFLLGPDGQAILAEFGFSPPPSEAPPPVAPAGTEAAP